MTETNKEEKKFYLVRIKGVVTEEVDRIIGFSVEEESSRDKVIESLLSDIAERTLNSAITVSEVKEISKDEMDQFVNGEYEELDVPRVLN